MGRSIKFDELKKWCLLNSFTHNKEGVDAMGNLLISECNKLGFIAQRFSRESIGDHLLLKSIKQEGKKILLLSHLDTVFPPGDFERWNEDDNWIYGPGVCDMKGGIYVALSALRNIFSEFGVIKNIDFLLVSDEETGSDDSSPLTGSLSHDYDLCIDFEAAGKSLEIVRGRKGIGTWRLNIQGKAAHAGNRYTFGVNANMEAAYKIQQLTQLTDLNKETTVNVGKISGGIGANTISPYAELIFEARYAETSERDRLLHAIENICSQAVLDGIELSLFGGIQRDVMSPTPTIYQLIEDLEKITGEEILSEFRGGGSDANITSSNGLLTLDGFGPYGIGDHTIHEKALKSSFEQRIRMVSKILKHHQATGEIAEIGVAS